MAPTLTRPLVAPLLMKKVHPWKGLGAMQRAKIGFVVPLCISIAENMNKYKLFVSGQTKTGITIILFIYKWNVCER